MILSITIATISLACAGTLSYYMSVRRMRNTILRCIKPLEKLSVKELKRMVSLKYNHGLGVVLFSTVLDGMVANRDSLYYLGSEGDKEFVSRWPDD